MDKGTVIISDGSGLHRGLGVRRGRGASAWLAGTIGPARRGRIGSTLLSEAVNEARMIHVVQLVRIASLIIVGSGEQPVGVGRSLVGSGPPQPRPDSSVGSDLLPDPLNGSGL